MFKLETHCHTYGTSVCATTPNELIVKFYKDMGYKGIVVTNHFQKHVYDCYLQGNTCKEKLDWFFNDFDNFKNLCNKNGIRAFFGVEVRVKDERTLNGTEYVVLGLDKEVFYREDKIFNLNQKELFELVNQKKGFMYQSHPFRTGVCQGDPLYMHGAESFNGHYHHKNHNDLALDFCEKNSLIKLSGTDFHHEDQPITAGIIVNDNVSTEKDLINALFSGEFTLIEDKETYEKRLLEYENSKK